MSARLDRLTARLLAAGLVVAACDPARDRKSVV